MYLLYCDETNLDPNNHKFFVYGGLIIPCKNAKKLHDEIEEIRKKTSKKNVLIIVGGEKVPGEIYEEVDYNIAITNQPHSEVAALGIFLHEYFHGKYRKFKDAKNKIIPQKHGKKLK